MSFRDSTNQGHGPESIPQLKQIAKACFTHVWTDAGGDISLLLYDVITLLCRRRHNNVYADLSVMPTRNGFVLVSGWSVAGVVGIIQRVASQARMPGSG